MQEYTLGFFFSSDFKKVALIKKKRPTWMKDKYNGIGGKLEDGENVHIGMVREFEEEAGIRTNIDDWNLYCNMSGENWTVYVLYCVARSQMTGIRSMTDEEIEVFEVEKLPLNECLSNVNWLVFMAIELAKGSAQYSAEIFYE